ncbi:MAG: MTH938/NDUFAF3 family protein [Anaerolineae bacterium]|nr:MTH938/NDUFAF3 family protein [Anaerolineae bacterium]
MQVQFIGFGEVAIDGEHYTKDVVIARGVIRKRDKQPSKALHRPGHTPLSAAEAIPWDCETLIIGTGMHGALPVLDDVVATAEQHGVRIVAVPTPDACALLNAADPTTTNAILHLTC